MKPWPTLVIVVVCATFVQAAHAQGWALRLPKDNAVIYRGAIDVEKISSVKSGQMLYGPGPALALGMLAGHAAFIDSRKDAQMLKMQEDADRVLSPFRESINGFTYRELMQRALDKTAKPANTKLLEFSKEWDKGDLLESAPVFIMTQDRKALVLQNVVVMSRPGTATAPYQIIVKVVSHAKDEIDLDTFWGANHGANLKEESARLLAHSLELAIRVGTRERSHDKTPDKTYRYSEGETKKMERARLVEEYCDRIVVENLRGWLISFPAPRGAVSTAGDAPCKGAPGEV